MLKGHADELTIHIGEAIYCQHRKLPIYKGFLFFLQVCNQEDFLKNLRTEKAVFSHC